MDQILTFLHEKYPKDNLTKISADESLEIQNQFPEIPEEYIQYMMKVGWGGIADDTLKIYSGPVYFDEIYGYESEDGEIILIGDDFSGYCFGYDTSSWQFGETSDDGEWEVENLNLLQFIKKRINLNE